MSVGRSVTIPVRRWLAALALLTISGVAPSDAASGAARDVSRIVSIGGAVTEILYALGMEKNVVAVDTTSQYPPAATHKPNVGYMRQLSAEGVLGVRPTLILAIDGSGPKETLAVLGAAGVPMVMVPDPYTGEGIVEKIRVIAQAAGVVERGRCIATQVRADLNALRQFETGIGKPRRVLFVLSFVNGDVKRNVLMPNLIIEWPSLKHPKRESKVFLAEKISSICFPISQSVRHHRQQNDCALDCPLPIRLDVQMRQRRVHARQQHQPNKHAP